MTLLITVFAAVICTLIWYKNEESKLCLDVPCWLFWGASIMWFVDAVVEFIELRAEFFTPALEDMLNDTFLGLSVVAFGLVIWVAVLLIKDPQGVIKRKLTANK